MTPIGGGVLIIPLQALKPDNRLPDEGHKVQQRREQIDPRKLSPRQWWWD